jgi:hypothetical protein
VTVNGGQSNGDFAFYYTYVPAFGFPTGLTLEGG